MLNRTQPALLVATIGEARSRILGDPTGVISYIDPKWSPNGKYLAYVLTDTHVTSSSLVVQEFNVSTNMFTSITPVGAPIVIVPNMAGIRNRHPDWSPDGNSLVFDSDASGTSIDVYTVQVFPTIGTPVRHTFAANRAEQNPVWCPDGSNRVAYDTNKFGPNVIEIVDLDTDALTLAETNFAAVSHSHPGWSSDGASVYYDAPENEDSQQNQDLWKLDLASQAKCPIHLDGAGDVNINVSRYVNVTPDGISYNNIYFESQAFGYPPGIVVARQPDPELRPAASDGRVLQPAVVQLLQRRESGSREQQRPERRSGRDVELPAGDSGCRLSGGLVQWTARGHSAPLGQRRIPEPDALRLAPVAGQQRRSAP
jgi:Tol biopolymer transport system component